MARRGHVPLRTCAGCRVRAPRTTLLRLARTAAGAIIADERGRVPGRGAYVHRDADCLDAALRRGGLARALHVDVRPDAASRLRELFSEERA
jgi:predicted RNA-binding protein YlxR (DUF448 family)